MLSAELSAEELSADELSSFPVFMSTVSALSPAEEVLSFSLPHDTNSPNVHESTAAIIKIFFFISFTLKSCNPHKYMFLSADKALYP